MNTQANNPREKQKLSSGFQECCHKILSPGVHPKFLVEISPILDFELNIGHFLTIFQGKICLFQRSPGASMSGLS